MGRVLCAYSEHLGPRLPETAALVGANNVCAFCASRTPPPRDGSTVRGFGGLRVGCVFRSCSDQLNNLVAQVSSGGYHSCGIDSIGKVQCWGAGDANSGNYNYGQVRDTPSGEFVQVSAAYYHSCAIDEQGEVQCWGWDEAGQHLTRSNHRKSALKASTDLAVLSPSSHSPYLFLSSIIIHSSIPDIPYIHTLTHLITCSDLQRHCTVFVACYVA